MDTDFFLADERAARAWQQVQDQYALGHEQQANIWQFYELLSVWNEQINLTALDTPASFLWYHVMDSLAVRALIDFSTVKRIVDVGSGAGFPGIPLAICYPHVEFVLIEVTHKKVTFLHEVITQLKLHNVVVCDLDWRTFLRKTTYEVDYFCARASLEPEELLRMFRPSSPYRQARLVYWASQHWLPSDVVAPYVVQDMPYVVGSKKRRYILLERADVKAAVASTQGEKE